MAAVQPRCSCVCLRAANRPAKNTAFTKPRAGHAICADVAAEIAALLDGSASLGERQVQAGDIAVLVRTHNQARMVQSALHASGHCLCRAKQRQVVCNT